MKSTLCLLALLGAQLAVAQEPGKTIVTEMLKHFETSKALSLAVAEAMPAESYSFKATEAEMSFGEQMNHLALANGNYCGFALEVKSPLAKPEDPSNKEAAIKNIGASYDFCMDGLAKLDDKGLLTMVKQRDNKVSKFELFWGGFTHAAHHRGQAEVYLRLKGITPPPYKF